MYNLVANGWDGKIIGYARSELSQEDFANRIQEHLKDKTHVEKFLKNTTYHSGQYDKAEDFKKLNELLGGYKRRLFYLALPPNVFGIVSENLDKYCRGEDSLVIVEKPFGRDLDSCEELLKAISHHWNEKETYRIDHFLGKEMVKNLVVLRFANIFFESVWNNKYIDNVQIVLKEDFGTQGRGGYFDEFGIVRDVMQNHLLQLLTVVCMEKPIKLEADDIRDEKVKVLRQMPAIDLKD
jgi:glucose-6-phosphate 1-dehydrogenase